MGFHEIESQALQAAIISPNKRPDSDADLLIVTLQTAVAINRKVVVALCNEREFDRKNDNSPVTATDKECEAIARTMFYDAFGSNVAFTGEETGGEFVDSGYCVAIDPIDGTWAFVSDTGLYGTTISIYKDGKPHLGLVSQPSASELMYAVGQEPTRLLRDSRWGSIPSWHTMPQYQADDDVLVNLQMRQRDGDIMTALTNAWRKKKVKQVRGFGGSPAVAIKEAAKGDVTYVANWGKPSTPYDLGGPMKLLQNAGGAVENVDGSPIKAIGHKGLLIAGVHANHRKRVQLILQDQEKE